MTRQRDVYVITKDRIRQKRHYFAMFDVLLDLTIIIPWNNRNHDKVSVRQDYYLSLPCV